MSRADIFKVALKLQEKNEDLKALVLENQEEITRLEKEIEIASDIIDALVSDLSGFEVQEDGCIVIAGAPQFQKDFDRAADWGNPDIDRSTLYEE